MGRWLMRRISLGLLRLVSRWLWGLALRIFFRRCVGSAGVIFFFAGRIGEWILPAALARRHFHRPPAEAIYIDFGPGVGVVVVYREAVKAVSSKRRLIDFLFAHREAHGVAGRDAGASKEHDGGGGEGGAVAFLAFGKEVGNEILPCRRFAGVLGVCIMGVEEVIDFLDARPLLGEGLRFFHGIEGSDGFLHVLGDGEVVAVDEGAIQTLAFHVGAVVGVADGFAAHHRDEGTGGELPQVGGVGFAFGGHGRAVIEKDSGAEVGIIREEEESALLVLRRQGEGGFVLGDVALVCVI